MGNNRRWYFSLFYTLVYFILYTCTSIMVLSIVLLFWTHTQCVIHILYVVGCLCSVHTMETHVNVSTCRPLYPSVHAEEVSGASVRSSRRRRRTHRRARFHDEETTRKRSTIKFWLQAHKRGARGTERVERRRWFWHFRRRTRLATPKQREPVLGMRRFFYVLW